MHLAWVELKHLPELYEAAGLKFDLSPSHIKTLMEFVRNGEVVKNSLLLYEACSFIVLHYCF